MRSEKDFKVTVHMQRRPDGGLRVWSDDVKGLVLSHRDPERVLADIRPALEVILEAELGCAVRVEQDSPIPKSLTRPLPPRVSLAARIAAKIDAFLRHDKKLQFSAAPCV